MQDRTEFFILEIELSGLIRRVIHAGASDSWRSFSAGENIRQFLEEGSREKFSWSIKSLRDNGFLAEWELFSMPGRDISEPQVLYLSGFRHNSHALVFGGRSRADIPRALEWLRDQGTDFPAVSPGLFENAPGRKRQSPDDPQTFDEITRLYGELSAMQRELAKKQAQLEQLNATISRYASSLEEMVADRTRQLEQSEARFRGIFEFSSLGIAILDQKGNILLANLSFKNIFLRIFPNGEVDNIKKLYTDPLDFQSVYQKLVESELDSYQFENQWECADGSACWLEINFFLVPVGDAQTPIAINFVEDITDRKESQRALIQAEKLTTVGKIAASLAHEINNPLQAIMGNLDLASETLAGEEPVQKHLRIASEELQRVKRIVSDLRSASRKPSPRRKSLEPMEEILEKVAGLVRKQCEVKGIDLTVKNGKGLPLVLVNNEQIQQVLLNLVINAIEAIPGEGKISLESRLNADQNTLEVRVCNSGESIPFALRDRLFEPFYTTKEEGLGLGLHISRQIMENHKGQIELLDDREQTCFRISLPVALKSE